MPEELPGREVYRASGRFHPLLLPVGFLIGLPAAILAGGFLAFCFQAGFFILIAMPLIGGFIASLAMVAAVLIGKCRNKFVAGVLGLLTGLVAYGSYYQFDFAYNFSRDAGFPGFQPPSFWELAPRVEVLPKYVELRLRTDRVGKAGDEPAEQIQIGGRQNQGGAQQDFLPPIPFMNWATLALDLLFVCGAPVGVGVALASRPFAETAKRWMTKHPVTVPPGDAGRVVAALRADDPTKLTDGDVDPIANPANLLFYYVPNDPASPVYLDVSLVQAQPNAMPFVVFKQVGLTADEVRVLAAKLGVPGLTAGNNSDNPNDPAGNFVPEPPGKSVE
jgi:hypothetical protein